METVDEVTVHHRRIIGDAQDALDAASRRAAAIAVGRRGYGLSGTALGRVARSLIKRAHCPVFVVG